MTDREVLARINDNAWNRLQIGQDGGSSADDSCRRDEAGPVDAGWEIGRRRSEGR